MKNTANYKEILVQKKAMMEVLEDVLDDMEYREKSILRTYREDGEEQVTDNEGNLLYLDDDGNRTTDITENPCMKSVYKEVMKDPSELDDRDRARYDALMKVKDAILALV